MEQGNHQQQGDTNTRRPRGKTFHLAVIGDQGVGKSALVERYCQGTYTANNPPSTEDIKDNNWVRISQKRHRVSIIDCAPNRQREDGTIQDPRLSGTEAVMIAYDITWRNSFDSIRQHYSAAQRTRWRTKDKSCVCLVGCKADLQLEREVDEEEGKDLATELGCRFFEVSSSRHRDVRDPFFALIEMILIRDYDAAEEEAKRQAELLVNLENGQDVSGDAHAEKTWRKKYEQLLCFVRRVRGIKQENFNAK